MKKLGLGYQELSTLRRDNCVYVDKTEIIYKLVNGGKYYFLSRPRRFGKSLLVNTMKDIFLGNKELFKETWIEDKWDFSEKYPVIKICFASLDYRSQDLDTVINKKLDDIATENNLKLENLTTKEKFEELIKKMSKKNPVVILIDEYDKPIIDYIGKETLNIAQKNRDALKNFYSVIKDLDNHIRLLFITGVSKFSRVSFFSELNNLTDITFDPNYTQIAGYTENEIIENYPNYLEEIEQKFKMDRDKLLKIIKAWYNGYSWDGENFVYNPYSLLNLFSKLSFKNYWFQSGTPTFLTKMIKDRDIDISRYTTSIKVDSDIFDSYEIEKIDITVLLFQAGYLTIKEKFVEPEYFSESYSLAYPNKEVKDSFNYYLLGTFTGIDKTAFLEITKALYQNLENRNIDDFIDDLKVLYAKIPSTIFVSERESYYHSIIYLLLHLMKPEMIKAEQMTNKGRIDAVVKTDKYIYVMEFKMNNPKEALKQIKDKKYYQPYLNDPREIICLGIAFDKKERNIKDYETANLAELENYNF